MFDWLFEGRTTVYVLLAAAAAVLLYTWWQTRRRALLAAGGVLVGLIGAYFLLDRLVETDREQVRRKVRELADAVNARDTDRVMANVSERFSSQGRNKAELRRYVETRFRERWIDGLTVRDIVVSEEANPDGSLPVAFRAHAQSTRASFVPEVEVRATFGRDPDGQWRMAAFEVFLLSNTPLELP